jgi:5-methyltetrahydrofolate--homocysteine methyltransferase
MEGNKPDVIYSLAQEYGFGVIGIAVDDEGIPKTSERRMGIIRNLVTQAEKHGIAHERLFFDPLVVAISTDNNAVLNFVDTLRRTKTEFPGVKITSGLSNISFGMPRRKLVNRIFLCLMLYEGMDSAILDPNDKDVRGTLLAFDALMGKDKNCRIFANAFRKGRM